MANSVPKIKSVHEPEEHVKVPSGVVEPVACDNALNSLQEVVPANPAHDGEYSESLSALLPTRRDGFRRFRLAFLTGLPLFLADVFLVMSVMTLVSSVSVIGTAETLFSQLHASLWFCGLYLVAGRIHGLYPGTGINAISILRLQTHSVFYAAVVFGFLAIATEQIFVANPLVFFAGILLCGIILPFARSVLRRACANFSWWGERAIVVGTTKNALSIFEFLQENIHLGLRPVGVVDDYPADYWVADTSNKIEFLGVTENLKPICSKHDCHWVIATTGGRDPEELQKFLTVCSLVPNLIVATDDLPLPSLWCSSFDAAGMAGFRVKDRLLHPMIRVVKRLIDVLLSASILLLVSPLLLLIAAGVRIASPGPVLFGDQRVGRGGRIFRALKFRTMVENSAEVFSRHLKENPAARQEWDHTQKLKDDPRIIAVIGNFLRKSSLDELPQLWNVLRGDMSLVGPRPIMPDEIVKYGTVYPLYSRVRPGLTGLWQVSGRNQTSYSARLQLVTYYVRSWSLWLDYYILLRTIKTVLTRQGSC